jgi:GntR family transcriptional repressor for pyruvate dehydrogenase complex
MYSADERRKNVARTPHGDLLTEAAEFSHPTAYGFALEQLLGLLERSMPGEQLPSQREIADALKISRPSLREALAVLQAMGLIDIHHGRGAFVTAEPALGSMFRSMTSLLLRDITFGELFEAREKIELEIAPLAARYATEEEIRDLEGRAEAMTGVDDPTQSNELDIEFHLAIARAAGNRLWLHTLDVIRSMLFSSLLEEDLGLSPENARERLRRVGDEHVAIARAIGARDGDAAAGAMREHLSVHLPFLEKVRGRPIGSHLRADGDGDGDGDGAAA